MKTIKEIMQETEAAVVVANQHGFITYINDRFEAIFGWTPAEIVGVPLTTIIPRSFHDSHHLGWSRFLVTGKPTLLNQPLTLKAVTKEGREFDAEHLIIAEKEQGEWVFGATIRPLESK